MIKLKDILSEAYAWERQEGKPLPTLAEVQAAYDARMREEAKPDFLDLDDDGDEEESMKSAANDADDDGDTDLDDKNHKYTKLKDVPKPYKYDPYGDDDDDNDDLYEAKADKDYDGDGEIESGSEEYLGSVDKAIKAAADTMLHGNIINRARAKSHLTKKDGIVHGIDSSGDATKLNSPSDVNNVKYKKFTIKSIDEYGGQDSDGIHADGPKNANSDVREKEQMIESFNKRMLGNLHGHEYILREAFKRK